MRLETLVVEARHSLARLARGGTHTIAAMLSAALSIGVATAFLSVAGRVWFSPLPVRSIDQLVVPRIAHATDNRGVTSTLLFRDFEALARSNAFESVTAFAMLGRLPLTSGSTSITVSVTFVAPDYFATLGIPVANGTGFGPDADVSGARPVQAVVSRALWNDEFAANAAGNVAWRVNGVPITVVGVAPAGFAGTVFGLGEQHVFVPLHSVELLTGPGNYFGQSRNPADAALPWLTTIARLRQGQALAEAARAAHGAIAPTGSSATRTDVMPLLESVLPPAALSDLRLFGVVIAVGSTLLLVIGTVHVGSLLITTGIDRLAELRLRSALGARRSNLISSLVVHNLIVVAVSGIGGLIGGQGILTALKSYDLPGGAAFAEVGAPFTAPVVVAWLLSVVAAVVMAVLAPMFVLSRGLLMTAPPAFTSRRDPASALLMGIQVALSLLLIFGAIRFRQAARSTLDIDTGIQTRGLVAGGIDPARRLDRDELEAYLARLTTIVGELPGIADVSFGPPPLNGYDMSARSVQVGAQSTDFSPSMAVSFVGPRYFDTLQQKILVGRGVIPEPQPSTHPIPGWLNAAAAARLSPGSSPVGRVIRIRGIDRPIEIVGVVATVKYFQLRESPRAGLYLPHWAAKVPVLTTVIARTNGSEDAIASAVQKAALTINPDVPVDRVGPVTARIHELATPQRFGFLLVSMFGTIGIVLTTIGVYATLIARVNSESRNLAVRLVCGAPAWRVAMTVLRPYRLAISAGVLLGGGLMPAAGQALSRITYSTPGGMTAAAVAASAIALVFLGILAIVWRRARNISPRELLQTD